MKFSPHLLTAALAGLLMVACVPSDNYAPVADVSGYEAIPANGQYRVVAGDTLYSIAWRYGADYQVLAEKNHITEPFDIHTGQLIYLRGEPSGQDEATAVVPEKNNTPPSKAVPVLVEQSVPAKTSSPAAIHYPSVARSKEPAYRVTSWLWPTRGKVLVHFSPKNKGIDIGGKVGNPIYAAAPGKVVYAGDGLRGYGNLIIVKHNSQLLSAYAYNSHLYVHEGDWVKKGQVLATMGRAPGGLASLHFEIRRAGLPLNPMNKLNK